jgi:hypothetical protein
MINEYQNATLQQREKLIDEFLNAITVSFINLQAGHSSSSAWTKAAKRRYHVVAETKSKYDHTHTC